MNVQTIDELNREGYTSKEARLIQVVQRYVTEHPEFAKRYSNGNYSLADIVRILAPLMADHEMLDDETGPEFILIINGKVEARSDILKPLIDDLRDYAQGDPIHFAAIINPKQ